MYLVTCVLVYSHAILNLMTFRPILSSFSTCYICSCETNVCETKSNLFVKNLLPKHGQRILLTMSSLILNEPGFVEKLTQTGLFTRLKSFILCIKHRMKNQICKFATQCRNGDGAFASHLLWCKCLGNFQSSVCYSQTGLQATLQYCDAMLQY